MTGSSPKTIDKGVVVGDDDAEEGGGLVICV